MDLIQEKLKILKDISGKSQEELASDLKVSYPAFNSWWTGKSVPRADAHIRIEQLLFKYGVDIATSNNSKSTLEIAITSLQKKHHSILRKILSRTDILDELSLQITYNSNAIEGSTLTKEDTRAVIFDKRNIKNKTLNEQLEAKNHDKAFRYLLDSLSKKSKIDESLIKKLHYMLMLGIRDDAGEYRKHPVRIVGSYVPTANYLKVPTLMKEILSKKEYFKNIEGVALFHSDFEKIHPFGDGNGRIGRLLVIGMLISLDIAPAIIKKKKRPEYYNALQNAQLKENYEPIKKHIFEAVIEGYRIIRD